MCAMGSTPRALWVALLAVLPLMSSAYKLSIAPHMTECVREEVMEDGDTLSGSLVTVGRSNMEYSMLGKEKGKEPLTVQVGELFQLGPSAGSSMLNSRGWVQSRQALHSSKLQRCGWAR